MNIHYNSKQPVCRFAAQELTAYLNRIGRPTLSYELSVCDLSAYGLPNVTDPQ